MSCVHVHFCFRTQLNFLETAWSLEACLEALLGETRAASVLSWVCPFIEVLPSEYYPYPVPKGVCPCWVAWTSAISGPGGFLSSSVGSPSLGSVLTCVHWRLGQSGGVEGLGGAPLQVLRALFLCGSLSPSCVLCALAALVSQPPRSVNSCQEDHWILPLRKNENTCYS